MCEDVIQNQLGTREAHSLLVQILCLFICLRVSTHYVYKMMSGGSCHATRMTLAMWPWSECKV